MNRLALHLFRLFLIAVALGLFGWLFVQTYAPSGQLTISRASGERSPSVSRPLPDTRTEAPYQDASGRTFQPIVGDPTYVTLEPPGAFDAVDVEVMYKASEAPLIELGLLSDATSESYFLQPLENRLLDELDWPQLREGNVVLYDRHGTYASLADFLVDEPPLKEIASYYYRFDRPYVISGYTPSSELRTLDVSLRGEHTFQTYLENESLDLSVSLMDMNRTLGADPVSVLVFNRAGELVASKALEDDGNVSADGQGSAMRTMSLGGRLLDGVYTVVLKANRDVFFRRLTTRQQKLTFVNQVFVGDEVGYLDGVRSTTLYSEAKNLAFETQHAEGVQELRVANVPVVVDQPFVQVKQRVRAEGVVDLTIPKGDVLVRGAGHYAFSRAMYFNPDPVRVEWNTDFDALGVNYVIATYQSPEVEGDLVTTHAKFDLTNAPKLLGAWKFTISIPGANDHGESVDLASMRFHLSRPSMTLGDVWRRGWKKVGRTLGLIDL